jgi:hypothetical protein
VLPLLPANALRAEMLKQFRCTVTSLTDVALDATMPLPS